jgi:Asp-tRNA(Asn)/Glu-tRNA(Gln) amidotransferase A subunit family amidase
MPADQPSPLQQLRAAIACEEVTPAFALGQALDRANSNASRNVYLALDADAALREAAALPHKFAAAPKPDLYGLPISLKDCFDLAGFITTCGSRFYAELNGAVGQDSAVATRLRSRGAVIIGKTHLHQLAYGITGQNLDYSDCVQPSNPQILTGGSSSGAVASVQEGSAVAGIGTDTGGSIRVPAALCGLVGYRASIELAHEMGLWRGGVHLAPSFDTLGLVFRDLRDAPLLAEALFSLNVPQATETSNRNVRIGRVSDDFLTDCEQIVLDGFKDCQNRLTETGARIVPLDSSFWSEAMEIFAPIQAHEAAEIHAKKTGGDFSHFEASIAERLNWGASIPAEELQRLRERHAAFRTKMDALLRQHQFLILPCAPVARLNAGADHTDARRKILRYTTPASLAGVPVVTLPAPDGAGIQLVAARGSDARLLAFAASLLR